MDIKFRKPTLQDCKSICDIHMASIRGLCKSHYTDSQIASWSGGRIPKRYENFVTGKHVIIAEHNSTPVGFGTFDLETGELIQLYIKPDYSKNGIGTKLLNEFFDMAKSVNLAEVFCKASLNAEEFYRNRGFESGERCKHQLDDGIEMDCIPMKISL